MLEVHGLAHGFGDEYLWKIDHLHWSGREMVHLQGDNGSGKTTLLRILSGLESPRQGRVHWRLDEHVQTPPCPGRVVYLHQQPYLFDTSVVGNLQLAACWHGLDGRQAKRRSQQMLSWCGLDARAKQRARSLSGGERLRLALARAWLLEPRALLLDEPTANLDSSAIESVVDLVDELSTAGCAILLCAHHSSSLTSRCRRRWQLRNARLDDSMIRDTSLASGTSGL